MTQPKGPGTSLHPSPRGQDAPPNGRCPEDAVSPPNPDPYQVAVSITVIITIVIAIIFLEHAALGLGSLGSHHFLDLLFLGADHLWEGRGTGHCQQGMRLFRCDVPDMGSQGHPTLGRGPVSGWIWGTGAARSI